MHKRILGLTDIGFSETPRREAGILYRIDESRGAMTLLVQSRNPLKLEKLPDGYGKSDTRDLGPLLEVLNEGRNVRYRITGNPVADRSKAVRGKISENKQYREVGRRALHGEEAGEWWVRRAKSNGLEISTLTMAGQADVILPQDGRKGTARHRHHLMTFAGEGVIRDAECVRRAVIEGVGRAKAYGAGLLSLAPAPFIGR